MRHSRESLRPDLNGTSCSIASCFAVADTIGTAELRVPVEVGIGDDLTLEVPLCVEHAHLLRMGVDTCRFDSRLQ